MVQELDSTVGWVQSNCSQSGWKLSGYVLDVGLVEKVEKVESGIEGVESGVEGVGSVVKCLR